MTVELWSDGRDIYIGEEAQIFYSSVYFFFKGRKFTAKVSDEPFEGAMELVFKLVNDTYYCSDFTVCAYGVSDYFEIKDELKLYIKVCYED